MTKVKKLKKHKYPLIQKDWNVEGTYGVFPKKGKMEDKCVYVGGSLNIARRCFKDHQKPSQFLLARLILGNDGFGIGGPRYEGKFKTYWDYSEKAEKMRDKYEFRLLDPQKDNEYLMIREFNPSYNIYK